MTNRSDYARMDMPTPDLIDILTADHRALELLFTELESGRGSPARRRELANVMAIEMLRHSVTEEAYLYPTAREVLSDGDLISDREIKEHTDSERVLQRIESLDPTDPSFDRELINLIQGMRHHYIDEESQLFPRLRRACPAHRLIELGQLAQAAKQTVR